MSYLVLARKWRPRTFAELVGQESVVRALRFALTEGRVHHAYLFSGIRGVGKTTVARILAKALNCEQGVSADPCGVCAACQEIDGGRFVDLIEVDAASRTKVDDTRELLDNVQYAPTRGRFKVYLIDEVHMLSTHSFNALLKTLEEPPPHVKFILATTDPQKLPITVLSRCLKLALRRLSDGQIVDHLANILTAEGLGWEPEALLPLAHAADGSVRDSLSLLDQAIAAAGGSIGAQTVNDMLGSVAPDLVHRIIEALASGDGETLLAVADEAYRLGVVPELLLTELLRAFHDIAIAQVVPAATVDVWSAQMAKGLPADGVQLYYEIGCLGRRQLGVAPDPESGVKMTLLRMLAFYPHDEGRPSKGVASGMRDGVTGGSPRDAESLTIAVGRPGGQKSPLESHAAPASSETPILGLDVGSDTVLAARVAEGEASQVLERLGLTGLMKHLAMNAVLAKIEDRVTVTVDPAVGGLLNKERIDILKEALCVYYGQPVLLEVTVAPAAGSPANMKREADEGALREAREAVTSDPRVLALTRTFNAHINEKSVRPRK